MQIFVKNLDSSIITLDVNPCDSIENVLDQIALDKSISQDVRIIYGSSVLEEGSFLNDYNIQEGSTLNLVVGLKGGAKKRKKKNYTTPKKNKHKKKKVKLAVLSYYKVSWLTIDLLLRTKLKFLFFAFVNFKVDEDGKVSRLRHECENKCGGGVFMAQHYNREYCGKCGFTYMLDNAQ